MRKVESKLASFLDVAVLPNGNAFISNEDINCAVLSPGHYMIFSNELSLSDEALGIFNANEASVVDISHSRCGTGLSGKNSTAILNKGVAINLSDEAIPNMSVIQTSVHSIGIIIFKIQYDDYIIFSYSSLFESLYEWLIDSAIEYGYSQP